MMKKMLREMTPPVLWRMASQARFRAHGSFKYGVEQSSEFYDHAYEQSGHWDKHYTQSHYYPLWTVIADRILRERPKRILDIGCGPGQFACVLRDIGIPEYIGIDFSKKGIARARQVCPKYEFLCENIFETKLLENDHYDLVLAMEFLEHVERDADVLQRIQKGTRVFGTVPNFPAAGHVRYFDNADEVEHRYKPILRDIKVTRVVANKRNAIFYVLEGMR